MKTDNAALDDMIRTLNDGRSFYEEAAGKVAREDLKRLFERIARTKSAIVNDMKNKVILAGVEPHDEGSTAGSLRRAWGELRAKIASDREASYVDQLEEFEDLILESFRDAIEGSSDPEIRSLARKYLPEVTRDHDEMRALKLALKH